MIDMRGDAISIKVARCALFGSWSRLNPGLEEEFKWQTTRMGFLPKEHPRRREVAPLK
jgi:hypothetical protein